MLQEPFASYNLSMVFLLYDPITPIVAKTLIISVYGDEERMWADRSHSEASLAIGEGQHEVSLIVSGI